MSLTITGELIPQPRIASSFDQMERMANTFVIERLCTTKQTYDEIINDPNFIHDNADEYIKMHKLTYNFWTDRITAKAEHTIEINHALVNFMRRKFPSIDRAYDRRKEIEQEKVDKIIKELSTY